MNEEQKSMQAEFAGLVANNGVDVHSAAFESLCLKYASPKWLNLIRELA